MEKHKISNLDDNAKNEICRVTRSKEQAKAAYDKMSRWYDVLTGSMEKKPREVGLHKLNAREGETVLEIGFGTGHCTKALAQSVGNSGKVYGIDLSVGMLNITQQRVREAGLSERVELKCGDATRLPFEQDTFDAIFMSFTLELFDTPEILVVLQECLRVLRIGGRICVVSMSREGGASLMIRLYEWLHKKFPNYADCRPIFVREALEEAGFHDFDIQKMSIWVFPVEIAVAKKI